jgi:hypothetical protein
MWLQTPETIEHSLWEGPLEPATDEAVDRLQRDWANRGQSADTESDIRNMPVVSIAQPEVWPLTELYRDTPMPSLLHAKRERSDFYLVRLACSFRTRRDHIRVDWARFVARLLPDNEGRQPLAWDVHPLDVSDKVKRNVKVSLSPTLKFQEMEAGVGGFDTGFEYAELQPHISATGVGEAEPMWDYQRTQGIQIEGSKWMYLLIQAPKGTSYGVAKLDLSADVEVRGSLLQALIWRKRTESADPLTVRLWR